MNRRLVSPLRGHSSAELGFSFSRRACTLLLACFLPASHSLAPAAAPGEFFEKKIRPIFADNCQGCHNPELKTGGLDLSTPEGFANGSRSGPIVSPDNPEGSRLLSVIGYEEKLKMPPRMKLSDPQIAALREWVMAGAPWPGAEVAPPANVVEQQAETEELLFTEDQRNFWAFQPVDDPAPPEVRRESWIQSPIDRFVLARLEQEGLAPASPADRPTLLRRATFDLTGLPPTEEEIARFVADDSPDAFERVVSRLLGSPRYGERWGRHWLDVARYADSTGNDEDHRYPHAWRYRDYVIAAFNDDTPYDQFVREQIAGDLLASGGPDGINRRGIVATGFLALGPKALAQQDKDKMLYDVYDEQMDVVTKAFLGLTVTCARCHDHKFDPILTKDYYSLVGIFASTKSLRLPRTFVSKPWVTPLAPEEEYQRYLQHRDDIAAKKFEIVDMVSEHVERHNRRLVGKLAKYMLAARRVYHDGAVLGDLAVEERLDKDVLGRWVSYLSPQTDDTRLHLSDWQSAPEETLPEVALAYQAGFEELACEWRETMRRWRKAVKKAVKRKNMPPPDRPKFDAEEDPFFYDVNFSERGPFALSEEEQDAVIPPPTGAVVAGLRQELKLLEETLPREPDLASSVAEGDLVEQKVFIRGDHHNPGESVSRGFPTILGGRDEPPITESSGRLALAQWLTRDDHPLTARVMVNRIWHWHFGEGLVRSPNNFGKLGERPTHPALLDYLAKRFVDGGWSIKKMHRLLMLSSTYRMSSKTAADSLGKDPENKLLTRFERRRLNVEAIRDGLLALDGSLDLEMGGTLQFGYGTDRENSSDRLSMNPEKVDRRLVYLPLRRANLPTLLNLFDFGDATTTTGKRSGTNVAPQALFMMNSDFVATRARNLARTLLDDGSTGNAQRLERAYLITLNRRAESYEIESGLAYLDRLGREPAASMEDLDAWQSLCRVLMASNEFIYLE